MVFKEIKCSMCCIIHFLYVYLSAFYALLKFTEWFCLFRYKQWDYNVVVFIIIHIHRNNSNSNTNNMNKAKTKTRNRNRSKNQKKTLYFHKSHIKITIFITVKKKTSEPHQSAWQANAWKTRDFFLLHDQAPDLGLRENKNALKTSFAVHFLVSVSKRILSCFCTSEDVACRLKRRLCCSKRCIMNFKKKIRRKNGCKNIN